jgi:predicted esterase
MKAKLLFLVLTVYHFALGQQLIAEKVSFLSFSPVIDGQLDDKLLSLQKNNFKYFFDFDNPLKDSIVVTYRLAYTHKYLYLYIETKADSITYRDRGFINGDGFKLLLAKPQKDSLTNEYYDIAFSPSKDKNYWARKRIWDYNRKQNSGKKLSNETQFAESCHDGKCGFEVVLAWKDIEPYNPLFSQKLGYNLYFAKAVSNNNAVGYSVVKDEGIWDEEIPKRNYLQFNFERPKKVNEEFIIAQLIKRNISIDEQLKLNFIAASNKNGSKTLEIKIQNDSSKVVLNRILKLKLNRKVQNELLNIDLKTLKPNHYNLSIYSNSDKTDQYDFVIFPKFDFNDIRTNIANNKHGFLLGTLTTLLFKINLIERNFKDLKEYETGKELLDEYRRFEFEYSQFLNGIDPFRGIKEPYRRAFKSKYDNSLQPYTIKLPKNYDPTKKYPLLVFLHGSGQDEQELLKSARSDGNFIELAPFARDMYRCYSSDSSQKDIVESIEDVANHFPVDRDKIIIGGFSMGGYGALRTFYQHPNLYKGVAVFAGHPDLANEWLGEGHPNFLDDKFLTNFSKIPVFIYHGRKDGALPIAKIEELISKLKLKNIAVTYKLVENKAHEYPDEETNKTYMDWLKKIVGLK